jgi:hypothetical protein
MWLATALRGGDDLGGGTLPEAFGEAPAGEPAATADLEPALVTPEEALLMAADKTGATSDAPLYLAGQEGVSGAALEMLPEIDLATPPDRPVQVLLYVLVDQTGQVQAVRTLEDGGLDPRALTIVQQAAYAARFRPATRDGVPGQQWTTLRIPIEGS